MQLFANVDCCRNSCYAGTGREDGDGVFDVTVCQFDTPIVLSWPHFLNADPKYQAAIQVGDKQFSVQLDYLQAMERLPAITF